MKKVIIAFAAIILPATLFADVQINFNATGYTSVHNGNNPEEEQWFEGDEYNGNSRMSLEYQWSSSNGNNALQFRQVNFFPLTGAWVFGPWVIKDHYCHNSCNIHHVHKYYHHRSPAPQWRREYSRVEHRHIYHYGHQPVYRDHHIHQAPVKVYHHERYTHSPKQDCSRPNHQRFEKRSHGSCEYNRPSHNNYGRVEHKRNPQPIRVTERNRN